MSKEKKVSNLTTPILVVLLLVAAFLVGMFWTKIQYLEQSDFPKEGGQTTPSPQAPQPQKEVLGKEQREKIESEGAAVKGKEGAPITIVEFSDFQCPFCKRYFEETYPQIWEQYGDKIRYVFHDYPLAFHPHAQKLAEAARCAGDQGKYWLMHDLIFEKREEWAEKKNIEANVANYAQSLGLHLDDFSDCLDSGKYTQAVKDDFALGQEVGVSGTPTFFVNGQKLTGAQPFEAFKTIIEAKLAE